MLFPPYSTGEDTLPHGLKREGPIFPLHMGENVPARRRRIQSPPGVGKKGGRRVERKPILPVVRVSTLCHFLEWFKISQRF